jgi:hypothetical protein
LGSVFLVIGSVAGVEHDTQHSCESHVGASLLAKAVCQSRATQLSFGTAKLTDCNVYSIGNMKQPMFAGLPFVPVTVITAKFLQEEVS